MNDDGQLQAAHLILDYEPLSRFFLNVGNVIRANDYRLARIDVSRPNFLAPYDLPPVDHPIPQGVPLAEEGTASSSSFEEEINKFQFEEEETQRVEAIVISEAEEETDEYSCIQTSAPIVTYGRNIAPTPQETHKSKPPINPPPPPSSASYWSQAKAQSWAEEKEATRGS